MPGDKTKERIQGKWRGTDWHLSYVQRAY